VHQSAFKVGDIAQQQPIDSRLLGQFLGFQEEYKLTLKYTFYFLLLFFNYVVKILVRLEQYIYIITNSTSTQHRIGICISICLSAYPYPWYSWKFHL